METRRLLTEEEGLFLLEAARKTVSQYLSDRRPREFTNCYEILETKGMAFVTIKTKNDELRGCIGYVHPVYPLLECVRKAAVSAATEDPRFSPVKESELASLKFEVSALTPFEPCDDLEKIEVGRHGLMIQSGPFSGLLLPQVATEYGMNREQFLEAVCQKAGLSRTAWRNKGGYTLYIFEAQVFSE
jgi:AmmeMemoRadiSam system protein A